MNTGTTGKLRTLRVEMTPAPGHDCNCDACCKTTCGCGSDWTDPRVFLLADQIVEKDRVIKRLEDKLNDILL